MRVQIVYLLSPAVLIRYADFSNTILRFAHVKSEFKQKADKTKFEIF